MAIKTCHCVNEAQDKIHGSRKRVMNPTSKTSKNGQEYRCTVCCQLN